MQLWETIEELPNLYELPIHKFAATTTFPLSIMHPSHLSLFCVPTLQNSHLRGQGRGVLAILQEGCLKSFTFPLMNVNFIAKEKGKNK